MNNLNDFTKEQLVGLLQKANDRRKTVERNMRKYAQRYYIVVEYQHWRNRVDELVNKEAQGYKDLYAAQECSCCKEKRWRKKYRETYSGMSEFCGKYINIVDDMMRQKNLPDNVKARLCDMRIAFVESREFLDKVMKDESNNI